MLRWLLFSFLCAAFLSLILPGYRLRDQAAGQHVVAVIDAGSSGNRLYLFTKTTDGKVDYVLDEPFKNHKDLDSHENDAGQALDDILEEGGNYLKENPTITTPVPLFIFATAGMRGLTEDKQKAIFDGAREWVKTKYSDAFVPSEFKVLSGRMEGFYALTTARELLEVDKSDISSVGIIDLGGASFQIAMAPEDELNFTSLMNDGSDHGLYVESFYDCGNDKMRDRLTTKAEKQKQDCGLTEGQPGNLEECKKTVEELFAGCDPRLRVPKTRTTKFYLMSGFFYVLSSIATPNLEEGKVRFDDYAMGVANVCKGDISAWYKKPGRKDFRQRMCFQGALAVTLLEKFGLDKGISLNIHKSINKKTLSWALGSTIYQFLDEVLVDEVLVDHYGTRNW